MSNKSKFGATLLIGALLGGIAAFFLSPKSGKENREMAKKKWAQLHLTLKTKTKEEIVKELFGSVTEQGKKLYEMAQKEMNSRLDTLKEKYPDIDKGKYMDVVKEVLTRLQEEKDATKDQLGSLGEFLKSRWETITTEGKKDTKKIVKAIKK
ncbi:MAG: hypothetical protein O3B87_02345 [bacterium]|nr:hypothetical protein [bacterium]